MPENNTADATPSQAGGTPFPAGTNEKVAEMLRLLAEAYQHYFAGSDGHCKSSEGAISLSIPPFFWNEENWQPSVEIYSYVLGPSRSHYFASVDAALDAVRQWHADEMSTVYCGICKSVYDQSCETDSWHLERRAHLTAGAADRG